MPCFILVIVEYLSDQYCFLVSLNVSDIVNGMEFAILCKLDSIIFQNVARVLESSDLTLGFPHFSIILLYKFDLMLVGKLLFKMLHNFINCRSERFDVGDKCLVIR
jgi:hypothetical protein